MASSVQRFKIAVHAARAGSAGGALGGAGAAWIQEKTNKAGSGNP
jgi:hypothetical protein